MSQRQFDGSLLSASQRLAAIRHVGNKDQPTETNKSSLYFICWEWMLCDTLHSTLSLLLIVTTK